MKFVEVVFTSMCAVAIQAVELQTELCNDRLRNVPRSVANLANSASKACKVVTVNCTRKISVMIVHHVQAVHSAVVDSFVCIFHVLYRFIRRTPQFREFYCVDNDGRFLFMVTMAACVYSTHSGIK